MKDVGDSERGKHRFVIRFVKNFMWFTMGATIAVSILTAHFTPAPWEEIPYFSTLNPIRTGYNIFFPIAMLAVIFAVIVSPILKGKKGGFGIAKKRLTLRIALLVIILPVAYFLGYYSFINLFDYLFFMRGL